MINVNDEFLNQVSLNHTSEIFFYVKKLFQNRPEKYTAKQDFLIH